MNSVALPSRTTRSTAVVVALALLASVLTAIAVPAQVDAATASVISPLEPRDSATVTADALPTVQMNGVAWDQAVVGNTVYVGGSFTRARPAGASPGTNETVRNNAMAYDIRTGVMTSWNPNVNGTIHVVTTSPDGSRLYIGGDFTAVGGQARSRIAAFDTSTGQLIANFAPPVGFQVRGIAATSSVVYFGGSFASVGSQPRGNLAAVSASNGQLLGWAPQAERPVLSLAVTPDGSEVIAAGHFETINGSPIRGLAKIDGDSGALLPWSTVLSNAGDRAAMTQVQIHDGTIYGNGYHFGPGGNQEGPWRVDLATGELIWVADCHGDTYDVFVGPTSLYAAGHAHYCGNFGAGFPQYATWRFQHNMAFTHEATGEHIREVHGYADWTGAPSPSIKAWLPSMTVGSYTGMSQASWTIEGNDSFVVVGGEFPRVNNAPQQGLVRFATQDVAPGNMGPRFHNNQLIPTLMNTAAGEVTVSWNAGWDPDDLDLTYTVRRTPGGIVHTTSESSVWWMTPGMSFVDRNVQPGQSYSYQLTVDDSTGNRVWGASRQITAAASVDRSALGEALRASEPQLYWPLGESPGSSQVADHSGGWHGVPGSAVTFGDAPGVMPGETAARVNNNNNGRIYAFGGEIAPTQMTAQVWFRTTATSGRLLGFGDLQVGNSGHRDRQIYLANNGRVHFGVRGGGTRVLASPQAYNDNQWHQATATLSGNVARLYVDGVLVDQRHDIVKAEEYVGHWRLGGDSQSGWPSAGNANYAGAMAHLAVYDRALTPAEVNTLYAASGRTPQAPTRPTDAYGQAVYDDLPVLYWRLGESSGTTAFDAGPSNRRGTYRGGHTKGVAGAIAGVNDTAVTFNGSTGFVSSDTSFVNPSVFSVEAWFRTTTTTGGKIVGFGNSATGLSSNYDRHIFMQNNGSVVFGVWTGSEQRLTSQAGLNDGQWHHVAATLSSQGMRLYVDGALVGSSSNTSAENYTGFWRVGGDRTWGGSTADYFAGTIDEVAVHARPLSASEVQARYYLGLDEIPNEPPTASFEVSVDGLSVAVDGSGSSDPDGSIESYAWDFGDGSSGSGVTASHTYEEDGEYEVTLTVTDDDGATASTSRSVEVAQPPENEPPTASFEVSVDGLSVAVDGSGSSDPDGSIVSYAWDFGDGSSGSGVTASHTYEEDGEYEVTLTVTDDDGATASASRTVQVEDDGVAAPIARDDFARSMTNSWGSADIGGAWTSSNPASRFSVIDGTGRLTSPTAPLGVTTVLSGVDARDVDATAQFSFDKASTGSGLYGSLLVRRQGNNDYRIRVRAMPSSTHLLLSSTTNGSQTVLANTFVPWVLGADDAVNVRLVATGSSPTQLSARVWRVGTDEPSTWTFSTTNNTAQLQGSGSVGFDYFVGGTESNAPVTMKVDRVLVTPS